MERTRTSIELKDGVAVEILVTPALYSVARRRGIDLVADANAGDVYGSYVKMLYCAAISAWDVAAVDDPKRGDFPYTFADFYEWAWADTERLARIVAFIYEALTGKRIEDIGKEAAEVKKNESRRG